MYVYNKSILDPHSKSKIEMVSVKVSCMGYINCKFSIQIQNLECQGFLHRLYLACFIQKSALREMHCALTRVYDAVTPN